MLSKTSCCNRSILKSQRLQTTEFLSHSHCGPTQVVWLPGHPSEALSPCGSFFLFILLAAGKWRNRLYGDPCASWPSGSSDLLQKSSACPPLVSTKHRAHLCVRGREVTKRSPRLVRRNVDLWWSTIHACYTKWKLQFPSGISHIYLASLTSSQIPHLCAQSLISSPTAFPLLFSQTGTLAYQLPCPWKSSFIWGICTLTCFLTLEHSLAG